MLAGAGEIFEHSRQPVSFRKRSKTSAGPNAPRRNLTAAMASMITALLARRGADGAESWRTEVSS
jgi:hypothetical protein